MDLSTPNFELCTKCRMIKCPPTAPVPKEVTSPLSRGNARNGCRRRQERRQRGAVGESSGGHAEVDANGMQGVESHPSDAGHDGMTGDRDEAGTIVQQTAEAAVREASTSHPHLEATRLART
ncbi:hypothetical protein FNYG_07126 [Fusarium nygamai]|uniref:Uncharacterized protein n=1 Tax=Gibberella nygamai TaxID=42673 RepID=A0A2K0WB62_GIBNY|nr:hypothetical protein FNYG_07126 [Fusarium nygamai]